MADLRSLKDRIKCRLNGSGKAASYSITDALTQLDKLIWKTANSYRMKVKHLDIDDLFQQGCLGVLTAWQKFDATRDIAFITYANWWIIKYIQNFCSAMEYSITLNSQNQKLYKEICMAHGVTDSVKATPKNAALALLAKTNNGLTKKLDKDEFSEEDEQLPLAEGNHDVAPVLDALLESLREKLGTKEYYVIVSLSGLVNDEPLTVNEICEKIDVTKDTVKAIRIKYADAILDCLRELRSSGKLGASNSASNANSAGKEYDGVSEQTGIC